MFKFFNIQKFPLQINSLTPLYEIVTQGDESYSQVSVLLENLKNALKEVNDLRNEPIILKIQSLSQKIIHV